MMRRFSPILSYRIHGKSMVPTFQDGHHVFVSRVAYAFKRPRAGNVVVVRHPGTGHLLIKRVIARPGQRVHLQWGRLFVDGQRIEHEQLAHYTFGEDAERNEWRVPKDAYFVIGDNPTFSTDSRHFGCIASKHIVGKVIEG